MLGPPATLCTHMHVHVCAQSSQGKACLSSRSVHAARHANRRPPPPLEMFKIVDLCAWSVFLRAKFSRFWQVDLDFWRRISPEIRCSGAISSIPGTRLSRLEGRGTPARVSRGPRAGPRPSPGHSGAGIMLLRSTSPAGDARSWLALRRRSPEPGSEGPCTESGGSTSLRSVHAIASEARPEAGSGPGTGVPRPAVDPSRIPAPSRLAEPVNR